MIDAATHSSEIVITAERAPQHQSEVAASATVMDAQRIERLGEPLAPALLRLMPSVAVATQGGSGALTEVRLRGSEANHTLLFIDGIRANDPAAGDAPRFELLNADLASRIEVIRGPQSALWGSQAIGGVVSVNAATANESALEAKSEMGSFGFRRLSTSAALASDQARLAIAGGWQSSDGIDIFGGGDRDGYRNLSGRLRASWTPTARVELALSGFGSAGRTEFDGYDPATFTRTHDLTSRSRLAGGRVAASYRSPSTAWAGNVALALLGSSNRNFFAADEINRTSGGRRTLEAQVERRFDTGSIEHKLIAAAEAEREEFRASDTGYGGFTAQARQRRHQALTAEWRAEAGPVIADVVVRRDTFNRFKDATSVRGSLLWRLGNGLTLAASYGEGIAQPTFFDLYGFFPGNFLGNPLLRPESSRGIELSARYRGSRVDGSLTWYRQRLADEIVDLFDPVTFVSTTANRDDRSLRSGLEAELGWSLGQALRLRGNYAFLRASEPNGTVQMREVRRPKHSGSVVLDGSSGRFTYGASLAYTGARADTNFDVFPFQRVRLGAYWLGGARVAYAFGKGAEIFARASNAFDARYQDAFGYRTEGRSLHAGIRLARGR